VTLILKNPVETGPALLYHSRTNSAASNRPQLVIGTADVEPPPPGDTTTVKVGDDAFVRDGTNAARNYGPATTLEVKTAAAGTSATRHAYLRFDLTNITTITNAKLRLTGRLSSAGSAIATQVFGATGAAWSESLINWNNKPAITTPALSSVSVTDTTDRVYELDVTAYLQAEKAAGRNVVTLVVKNAAVTGPAILFKSGEAPSGGPELRITA
jgi:hypothetical protein